MILPSLPEDADHAPAAGGAGDIFKHAPPERHAKTVSAVLGEIVWLMSRSPLRAKFQEIDDCWISMMRSPKKTARDVLMAVGLLVLGLGSASSISQAEDPKTGSVEDIPWGQRTWEQKAFQSSYDDKFTNKHEMVFRKDPYTWALSPEFAERFGMPKDWIDPGLKGALAVAWRTTTIGLTYCGYGSDPNACWQPFTCQMDIYVDSKAPIPWRFNDVERDFLWDGLSSLDFVPMRLPAPRRWRYAHGEDRFGSKGVPFYTGALKTKTKAYTTANQGFFLIYFDRNYAPGVTLLGFESACPNPRVRDAAVLRFFTEEERRRTRGVIQNYAFTIEFSERFMRTIGDIYQAENESAKSKNQVRQKVMDKYLPK